jgi:hypothetical protein
MRASHGPAIGGVWILTAVLVATACHEGAIRPRSEGLARQLREVALTAERDSLLMEVAANGKLLNDIQAELTGFQPRPAAGTPESPALEITRDQRAFALDRVREITTRLKTAENQLAASERRAERLTRAVDSLSAENAEARSTITDLVAAIASQRTTMTELSAQLESFAVQNQALADSIYRLTDDRNTAYFVVGTRAELLKKGVLVEDGHRSIPLIGRRGVQPARDLPLGEFTSIDRSTTRDIPLPGPDKSYRIVSRQNLTHVSGAGTGGRVKGHITIASPEGFWEPSRYLIVVEQ